jgi:hypothetical protein
VARARASVAWFERRRASECLAARNLKYEILHSVDRSIGTPIDADPPEFDARRPISALPKLCAPQIDLRGSPLNSGDSRPSQRINDITV